MNYTVLLFMLAFPFAAAFFVKLLPAKHSSLAGLFFLAIQALLVSFAAAAVFALNEVSASILNVIFRCDIVSLVFAFISVFIGIFIYLFSLGYFKDEKPCEQQKFAFWGLVFVGSMMGVVLSDNLVSLYLFWELAGLCSWRLIGFYRKRDHLLKADKAFLITSAGAGFMLISFALIYLQTGSLSLSHMQQTAVSPLIFALFFLGVITKSASFPFHTWLPDASVAPTPVTAFLHAAVLVKIGIYGLLRVFGITLFVSGWVLWAGWLALFSSFIAGMVALRENDIKKVLAFSTVSQLGFMIAGLMMFNIAVMRGVLIFYIAHALGKGCLFLCAGIIERVFGTKDIKKMGGLMKKMPALSFAFIISMFSVIGIPPLPGFFGKLEVIAGMLAARQVFFALFAILASVLTLLYLFRLFLHVFMGESGETDFSSCGRAGFKPMLVSVVILAAVSLLLGIAMVL